MMGKVLGILFGLMMMVVVVKGLWCHKCAGGAACDTVEEGKKSSFSIECVPSEDPELIADVCFSSGEEGAFVRKCFPMVKKEKKVGCTSQNGGEICMCDKDFCNGKKSTSGPNGPGSPGSPGGAGWNKPSDNFLNFCWISIIIIISQI